MVVIRTSSGLMSIKKITSSSNSNSNLINQKRLKEEINFQNSIPNIESNRLPLCWMCCERPIDSVMLNCGHLVACMKCAQITISHSHKCLF